VLRRKGGGWFFVTAKGKSSHAGVDPEKGNNAVLEVAHQIITISTLNNKELGTSANVTIIRGGDRVNIIPDEAKAAQIGIQADYISTGGCSDGNLTSSMGVPTIDGIGLVGGNSHSLDEFVELDSIPKITRIVAEMCGTLIVN